MVAPVGEAAWSTLSARARTLDAAALAALSPMVVLAPHPDDETLGCGGLLATASDLGLEPRVAFLTDGSASHRDSPSWPRARLVQTREAEALAALAALGVGPDQALFLGWPDSAPHPEGGPAHAATLDALCAWTAGFAARSLWAPWPGEAHCDHEAASRLADALARRLRPSPRRFDYMVWGWASEALTRAAEDSAVWALPCAAQIDRRRRALRQHRTQAPGLITDAAWAFLIPPELQALTDRPTEIFLEREPVDA